MRKNISTLLTTLLIITLKLSAQDTVSGVQNRNLNWQGRYVVASNLKVTQGHTLTIGAGSVVQMAPGASITVEGALRINGNIGQPVLIQSSQSEEPGIGFIVTGQSQEKVAISGLVAYNLVQPLYFQPGWKRSEVRISESFFRQNQSGEPLIYVSGTSQYRGSESQVKLTFNRCRFFNNKGGVFFQAADDPGLELEFSNSIWAGNRLRGKQSSGVYRNPLFLQLQNMNSQVALNFSHLAFADNALANTKESTEISIGVAGPADQVKLGSLYNPDGKKAGQYSLDHFLNNPQKPEILVEQWLESPSAGLPNFIESYEVISRDSVNLQMAEAVPPETLQAFWMDANGVKPLQDKIYSYGKRLVMKLDLPSTPGQVMLRDTSGQLRQITWQAKVDQQQVEKAQNVNQDSLSKELLKLTREFLKSLEESRAINTDQYEVKIKPNPWSDNRREVGIFGGGAYYLGDLNRNLFLPEFLYYGVGVNYRLNLNQRWALRAQFLHAKVGSGGGTALLWRTTLNETSNDLNYFSPVNELSLMAFYHLRPYTYNDKQRWYQRFVPSIGVGVAPFHFNPKRRIGDDIAALQPYGTEGQNFRDDLDPYSRVQLAIPVEASLSLPFRNWVLALEVSSRITTTDYLDDVGQGFFYGGDVQQYLENAPDFTPEKMTNPSGKNSPDSRRSSGDSNDSYVTVGFRLSWLL